MRLWVHSTIMRALGTLSVKCSHKNALAYFSCTVCLHDIVCIVIAFTNSTTEVSQRPYRSKRKHSRSPENFQRWICDILFMWSHFPIFVLNGQNTIYSSLGDHKNNVTSLHNQIFKNITSISAEEFTNSFPGSWRCTKQVRNLETTNKYAFNVHLNIGEHMNNYAQLVRDTRIISRNKYQNRISSLSKMDIVSGALRRLAGQTVCR